MHLSKYHIRRNGVMTGNHIVISKYQQKVYVCSFHLVIYYKSDIALLF